MAHEITQRANGMSEFAFVGSKAWHGLGQQLTVGAAIEEWARAAGMDWSIRRAMVRYFADPEGSADCSMLMDAPDESVLFRSDSLAKLGIVSPDYEIVQPRAVLEFFRDLVSDQRMTLESAGTLFGGRRFFALAKMAEQTVIGDDKVGGYLLLCTSADGTMATEARQTTVRVVCNNTLRLARSEKGGAVAPVKVSHAAQFCDKRVKDQLGLSRDNFERGMTVARALAQVKVTDAAAQDYVRRLLRPAEAAAKDAAAIVAAAPGADATFADLMARAAKVGDAGAEPKRERAPRGEAAILELFGNSAMGGTLAGAQGTAWGLVNAVTEYVDHHATARTADHRRAAAWFGAGDELKNRALDLAQTLG